MSSPGIGAAANATQVAEFYARLPTTRSAAGALLIDDAGRILLVERVYDAVWPWGLPGGIIEADESPLGACVREVRSLIRRAERAWVAGWLRHR